MILMKIISKYKIITNSLIVKKILAKKLDNILDEINKIALEKFVFVDVNYDLNIADENKIIVDLKFKDLEKFYVEQIIYLEILLLRKVIRNSLIVDEVMPIMNICLINQLTKLNQRIFKSVDSKSKTQKIR